MLQHVENKIKVYIFSLPKIIKKYIKLGRILISDIFDQIYQFGKNIMFIFVILQSHNQKQLKIKIVLHLVIFLLW